MKALKRFPCTASHRSGCCTTRARSSESGLRPLAHPVLLPKPDDELPGCLGASWMRQEKRTAHT
eukprot:3629708-Rhodomonas_salina.1